MRALRGAPTFSFDGIDGSMTVIDTMIAESYPEQYFITISFECAHPDYGARATIVVVSAGEIRSAMIDGECASSTSMRKEPLRFYHQRTLSTLLSGT